MEELNNNIFTKNLEDLHSDSIKENILRFIKKNLKKIFIILLEKHIRTKLEEEDTIKMIVC